MKVIKLKNKNVDVILRVLGETYPDAKCALSFGSPYELLVSTILSAQCTDVRVNKVTDELYREYNTPEKMVALTEPELEEKIRSCGFYRNKSKNILATSRVLIEKFGGHVPNTMEELIKLPGVGRKTADVVLSNAFGIPAIAVDTHVFRVSNRLGIGKGTTPLKVEEELMKNIPRDMWSISHHYLIWHGRKICKSRKPDCERCSVAPYCDYFNHPAEKH
ncbi:endonuclease III [Clostridium tyrobutyricum]|uniref:endonuclease III n=1 Tax=Clostridium tyrobutyricum TaxID=1519 RepID=UPI0003018858|nr:endonuclease III [Clostridium tyrobutyricum]MBV4421579.1 endonuclease III [Clostridium tyrobutyricum]MBV4424725.1 endonuclease III [Clostridium tyrobutyricum]MBV4436660.1 endonuclease III [Clostridium tyrobutyricum]MEA5007626.1 endonuclease III [Clostridium tyrobutyricum]